MQIQSTREIHIKYHNSLSLVYVYGEKSLFAIHIVRNGKMVCYVQVSNEKAEI